MSTAELARATRIPRASIEAIEVRPVRRAAWRGLRPRSSSERTPKLGERPAR